jgi:hypothetical protein
MLYGDLGAPEEVRALCAAVVQVHERARHALQEAPMWAVAQSPLSPVKDQAHTMETRKRVILVVGGIAMILIALQAPDASPAGLGVILFACLAISGLIWWFALRE